MKAIHSNSDLCAHAEPWQIFCQLSQKHREGFFLEAWGPMGEYFFGFDPVEVREGQADPSSRHFEKSWRKLSAEIEGSSDYLWGLLGYGCGRELDRVRGEWKPVAADFRLARYAETYTWSEQGGLRKNGQKIELEVHVQDRGEFQIQDLHFPVDSENYQSWVRRSQEYILAGDIFQANLAHPLQMRFEGDAQGLYQRIRQHNPSPYGAFWFEKQSQRALLSNSPELLVELSGDKLLTKPIAGTRKRGRDPEHEKRLLAELFASEKEQAEHLMLVDLERNDLGRIAQMASVELAEFMACEQYQNVTHIVSTVGARLRQGCGVWEIIKALFPGGTITGAPKLRSMEIIQELELYPRGFYTGSMLWWDGAEQMSSNILIRSMQIDGQKAQIHVGAGIVADSDPKMEYQETMNKAAAWMGVLQ